MIFPADAKCMRLGRVNDLFTDGNRQYLAQITNSLLIELKLASVAVIKI